MRQFATEHPTALGIFRRQFNAGPPQWTRPVLEPSAIQIMGFVIPNVRGKIAAWPPKSRDPVEQAKIEASGVRRFDYIVDAVRRAGPRKVLFGSDGPWLHPGLELHKAVLRDLEAVLDRVELGLLAIELGLRLVLALLEAVDLALERTDPELVARDLGGEDGLVLALAGDLLTRLVDLLRKRRREPRHRQREVGGRSQHQCDEEALAHIGSPSRLFTRVMQGFYPPTAGRQ